MASKGFESRLATVAGIEFTVNTAATDANLSLVGAVPADLTLNAGTEFIQLGDNCIIKGFALTFPYQFGQGLIVDEPIKVFIGWIDSGGLNSGQIVEIGDGGRLNISDPNYWYQNDIFVPQPATAASKWKLRVTGIQGRVSQINAPAALNGLTLYCTLHMMILTTLSLSA